MVERLAMGEILEGKYRILHQIGEGGMGVVYAAEHMLLRRTCAVKVLHPSEATDQSMIERFNAEAQSAANIRHKNIVEVMDFGLTPDFRPFFVMEFLKGESLADKLDVQYRLAERDAVEIADQILSGLARAHKAGVIHRDLKPENILLARDAENRITVKILDFGISKIVSGSPSTPPIPTNKNRPGLTQHGVVLGTPGYMAPETIWGAAIDGRADLFAVGVLLFEMLTGQRPFKGSSVRKIMEATTSKSVPRPRSINPSISLAMERLVLTALAREADDRVQTAEEFLDFLTAVAVGHIPEGARVCKTDVKLPSDVPPPEMPNEIPISVGEIPLEMDTIEELAVPLTSSFEPPRSSRNSVRPRRNYPSRTPKRRFRFRAPISLPALLVLGGLGYAIYYFVVLKDPITVGGDREAIEESQRVSPQVKKIPATVTIWVDLLPRETTVFLNEELIEDRPIVAKGSDTPVVLRFEAQGYKTQVHTITPNAEKTVTIRMKKTIPKNRKIRKRKVR